MESSASGTVSLHERLMSSTTFLVILGIALYTDNYLTIFFGENVFSVSLDWYQENFQLKHITLYILSFSFLYGIVLPVFITTLDYFIFLKSTPKETYDDEVLISTLKRDAIVENNPVMFKFYENSVKKLNNENHVRKLMLAIVLMSIFGLIYWISSNEAESDNFAGLIAEALVEDKLFSGVYKLLLFFISIWFLVVLKTPSSEFNTYEYIEGYQCRHESMWIREIESGLIDKSELSKHFHCISKIQGGWFKTVEFDCSNESHLYCEAHKFIKNEKGNIKPTVKGLFIRKYLS